MTRHVKKLLLFCMMLLLPLLVSGCLDALDINKRMIVTTVAIDRKEDEIWFYIETANIQASEPGSGGAGSTGSKFSYIKGHGKTFSEGRLAIERQMDLPLYLGDVRTLLLTEAFASQDMLQYLYRLRADELYRKKVITVITRSDLDEMFQALNSNNISVGYSIENTITTLETQGGAFSRTTARILENLSDNYSGLLLPCIGMIAGETNLSGYSVVNGSRVTGFIPIGDCTGVTLLKVDRPVVYFNIPYQDNILTIKTVEKKRKARAYYQNGEIAYRFSLGFDATVEYGSKKTPYNLDEKALKEVKALLTQAIADQLNIAADQAQNVYKTDYLQMDDVFRISYPVAFEQMNWQESFQKAKLYWSLQISLGVSPSMDYGKNQTR